METGLSIAALVISVFSSGLSLFTFLWTANRDRKQATLEAYNRLQAEVFDKLNTYRPAEICSICTDKKSEGYKLISGYLARIQHFCVGLDQGIYHKNTFYALSHGYFDKYQLKSRILPIIECKNSSKNAKEQFYKETLAILAWMDKKSPKK